MLDLLKNTDPATVTQHGLYTRDLSQLKYPATANRGTEAGSAPQTSRAQTKFPDDTSHNKENIGRQDKTCATHTPSTCAATCDDEDDV